MNQGKLLSGFRFGEISLNTEKAVAMHPLDSEHFKPGQTVPGTVYRVLDVIGSGGMGRVYLVEHQELGKEFVLKALHLHLASRTDLVGRLRNEWRALGKLNHPNIVQVTDAGQTTSGLPYYVMESLKGHTLAHRMTAPQRPSRGRSCQIIVEVLRGLSAAHATGAIHRDIKPPNIFVPDEGPVKLLDFGIAKLRDRVAKVVTAGGVSIGTPRYMAPEQAQGTDVDGRADIYAAGLVLYELLVGRGPFAHIRDPNELVMAHIGIEPERADHIDASVPPEIGDLLQRWLSKSPSSRPRTAHLAERELEAVSAAFFSGEEDDSDLTLERGYDARTLGAEAGSTTAPTLAKESEVRTPRKTPQARQMVSVALAPTQAEAEELPVEATKTAAASIEEGPLADPKKTLSLGSAPFDFESTQGGAEVAEARVAADADPSAADSHDSFRSRRISGTPPPLSWHPPPSEGLRGRRFSGGLAFGVLLISFGLAWLGARTFARNSEPTGIEAGADLDPAAEGSSTQAVLVEYEAPPEPPAETEKPQEIAEERGTPRMEQAIALPTKAINEGTSPPPVVSPAAVPPAAAPAPKSASPPKSTSGPKNSLPGSGLW